jgi:hypothetical protein
MGAREAREYDATARSMSPPLCVPMNTFPAPMSALRRIRLGENSAELTVRALE